MQFSFVFVGTTLLAAGMAAAQAANGLAVSTLPALTTCVANRLTWTSGQAPFTVYIIVPGQVAQRLDNLGTTNDQFLVYTPTGQKTGITPNDEVSVYVTDAAGFFSASAAVKVISGGTCASSSAAAGSATTSGTMSAVAPTTASTTAMTTMTTATTTTTTTTTTATRPSSTTTTTASATTTAPPSGAAAPRFNGLTAVVAGAVGVVAAALI
ncbi:hypothetical protein A4X09_0g3993 [Tilletia walkeri]|uniref:Uncharacterized protein n=1 Tax=Tilletia walkeri TaxID=117179 RepID=A0A8X7NA62_9BASI|nr:hypothetical protein A4X09_0g3993 [Tilletia walkeri]